MLRRLENGVFHHHYVSIDNQIDAIQNFLLLSGYINNNFVDIGYGSNVYLK